MKRQLILILVLVFLVTPLVKSLSQEGVEFTKLSFEQARVLAKDENKKILIDFYADWCLPCKELDKNIFQDSVMSKYINERYISLKINAESDYGKKIASELSLPEAYPTVILLTAEGKEIDRIVGLFDREKYFRKFKDYSENINVFGELLRKVNVDKSNLDLNNEIAVKYFERGNYEKAIAFYTGLTDSEKYNSTGNIYFSISRCYLLLQNKIKAKEFAEKAININPSQTYYKEYLKKLDSK
jgi:thiol-disulfide isomerase/thioredoxin